MEPKEFWHLADRIDEYPEYIEALTPLQKAEIKAICSDAIKAGGDIAAIYILGEAPEIWPDNLPLYQRVLDLLSDTNQPREPEPKKSKATGPAPVKIIAINKDTIEPLFNCLKDHVHKSQHPALRSVLEGNEIAEPVQVRVMAKQLIGVFVKLKAADKLGATTNKNVAEWMDQFFEYWDIDKNRYVPISTATAQKSFSKESLEYQPNKEDEICNIL